ncbi:hypothetical protein [Dactylosporangium sp. NPDC051484]|uniref:hypothetical protein n=1 Tax=Dactylosporangium sp. NPDC051484 TaxID=3154942 RepID=UPI00344C32E6
MTPVDPLATPLPGGLVLLGPAGTLMFWRALVTAETAARRDGIRAPADVAAVRRLLEVAARDARSAVSGSTEVPPPADLARFETTSGVRLDPIGTGEAASLLGCGQRNVRDLCRREVFASAQCRSGVWTIERDEVLARRGREQVRRARIESPARTLQPAA